MKKYRIFIFLFNSEVALGDLIGRMIINFHQNRRRSPAFPGVVTECFPHGVAADVMLKIQRVAGVAYDAESL